MPNMFLFKATRKTHEPHKTKIDIDEFRKAGQLTSPIFQFLNPKERACKTVQKIEHRNPTLGIRREQKGHLDRGPLCQTSKLRKCSNNFFLPPHHDRRRLCYPSPPPPLPPLMMLPRYRHATAIPWHSLTATATTTLPLPPIPR
jgi:hypothetical protein